MQVSSTHRQREGLDSRAGGADELRGTALTNSTSRITRLRLKDLGPVGSFACGLWLVRTSVPALLHVLHPSPGNSKSVDIRAQAKRSTAGVRVGGGLRILKPYSWFWRCMANQRSSRRYELTAVKSIDPVWSRRSASIDSFIGRTGACWSGDLESSLEAFWAVLSIRDSGCRNGEATLCSSFRDREDFHV